MSSNLKSIISDLHSNEFHKRSKAVSTIMSSRDPSFLMDLSQQVEENPHDDSIIIIVGMCEEILKEDDTTITHLVLGILNIIIHNSTDILVHKAQETLTSYFRNLNIIDGHKALTIEKAWHRIKDDERFYLTEIIKEFRYHTLVNLLLSNFEIDNNDLIITSIYALNDLNESRGNRFFRDLLDNDDPKIKRASIYALGNTGIIFDAHKIKPNIQHVDINIRKATIIAIRKLYRTRSLITFKENFYSQPLEIQKVILDETTTLHTPKALLFLLELLGDQELNHISNIIEWSIYNIQTKKKIGTIINFFPNADKKTKYRLVNLLGDFDDDKCKAHFINILNSNEDIMVKALALHHLSHYKDKLSILEMERHLNSESRILRYSSIKSLLNINQEVAKRTIDNLLSAHDDLSDETIMLIVKNLKNQPRIQDNELYGLFIFEVLQTGSDDTKLSILNILPKHHSFEVFQFLTELYHDPDYDNIKDHVALAQLHIILDFPYYLSTENLGDDLDYLLNLINPYKANFQIILHLIRLDFLTESPLIQEYISNNKRALALKLNYIINKNELTVEDLNMVIDYLFSGNMFIHEDNFQFIIDNHFSNFEDNIQRKFLKQLLLSKSEKHYNFIVDNYFANKDQYIELKPDFNSYLGSVL